MTNNEQSLPHWDLTNVYPSLDSSEFKNAIQELKSMVADLEEFLKVNDISRSHALPTDANPLELGNLLEEVINRLNATFTLV